MTSLPLRRASAPPSKADESARLLARAEIDLANIWDYSAMTWGPDQADRYTDEIEETCGQLASGWKRGRSVDVRNGYLKYATGSHMLYFRDLGSSLEIIRILHKHQDVSLNLPD